MCYRARNLAESRLRRVNDEDMNRTSSRETAAEELTESSSETSSEEAPSGSAGIRENRLLSKWPTICFAILLLSFASAIVLREKAPNGSAHEVASSPEYLEGEDLFEPEVWSTLQDVKSMALSGGTPSVMMLVSDSDSRDLTRILGERIQRYLSTSLTLEKIRLNCSEIVASQRIQNKVRETIDGQFIDQKRYVALITDLQALSGYEALILLSLMDDPGSCDHCIFILTIESSRTLTANELEQPARYTAEAILNVKWRGDLHISFRATLMSRLTTPSLLVISEL